MSNPYLSIILVGRNDNYGGDFIKRLQTSLDWNTRLLEEWKIPTEIIIVNWNPVPENKPFEQLITFVENRKYVSCKIISVSPEIHQHFVNPELRQTVPVFEFIAKNAGIRRATGEYILCINADILIHPDVIKFIAARKINTDSYYRTNRFDFNGKTATNSIDDFYKMGSVVSLKGFLYSFNSFFDKKIQYLIFRIINRVRIAVELWKYKNQKISNLLGVSVTYNNAAYYAHCHNSGDFMLMHKLHWFQLRGYPEYTKIATHTDAVFTIFAYAKLKEYVFSCPVFHQEHERRYSWDAIKHESVFLEAYAKFEDIARHVFLERKADNFLNDETWGLQNFSLPENTF